MPTIGFNCEKIRALSGKAKGTQFLVWDVGKEKNYFSILFVRQSKATLEESFFFFRKKIVIIIQWGGGESLKEKRLAYFFSSEKMLLLSLRFVAFERDSE